MERLLAERFKIIYSKGKKKKRVPALFTIELNKTIFYLVKHRDDVGVLKTTVLQLLDINNVELEWVVEHLGHMPDVQKTWYRQQASTMEMVAKLLIAKDNNVNVKKKKMRDITGIHFSCILSFNLYFYYSLLLCM